MHAFFVPIALALATLAAPSPNTEVIPLRYRSASEVERMLVENASPGGRRAGDRAVALLKSDLIIKLDARAQPLRLLPGLVALAVDEERNALTVIGSAEAIEEIRSIVRFVDIPARQIRLTVRTVPSGDPSVQATEAEAQIVDRSRSSAPLKWVAIAEGKQAAALAAAPAATEFEIAAANNREVRLNWSADGKHDWPGTTLTPRINGDGSVTVFVGMESETRTAAGATQRTTLYALRRVIAGQTVVVVPEGKEALVVTVREVLPPAEKAK